MPVLTIMRGVSGSGKSTRARMIADMTNATIISRDDIRKGLFGVEFDPFIEDRVSVIEKAAIESLLRAGIDVISDNTYIEMKYVKTTAKIGYRCNAEVKIEVVDEPLAVCLQRNILRAMNGGRNVPEDVIRKQHSRFQGTKNHTLDPVLILKQYVGTPGKPKAFMYDLDGTAYHMNDKRGPYDHNVDVDDPDEVVQDIVATLALDYIPIAMSGRVEAARERTEFSLNRDDVPFDHLFMRADGDMRPDNLIKADLFDTYVRDNYDVQFVIDDRDQVVRMWKSMGLKVLNVSGLDDGMF